MKTKKTIKAKIPAGVGNNSSIRIAGGGEAGEDGNGDLYLRIKVTPHREFMRKGYDIFSEKEISFSSATLGDRIEANTLYGPVKLKIPAGTSSHTPTCPGSGHPL